MDQAALEALLAQIAPNNDPRRLVHTQSVKQVKVTVPADPNSVMSKPDEKIIDVPVQEWVDPGTGMTLIVEGTPEGTWKSTFQGVKQDAIGKPAVTPEQQAGDQKPPTERVDPANPSRRQVWNPQGNGGKGAWEDAGAVAPDASKPPAERVNPADPTKRQVWNPKANGGQGGWEDAGIVAPDASKPPTERVDPSNPSKRQVYNPTTGKWEDAGAVAQTKPPEERDNPSTGRRERWDPAKGSWIDIGASQVSPYTTVHFDPDTRKWWGLTKAGTWEEMPGGGPGTQPATQTAGPPLPTIILGHSQDALRAYQAKLDAEVAAGRMTPAQRTARWNEALQMAQQTIAEATLQQRENESNLNASVNLATNRLSNATSGFNSALDFVSKMNDKLPVGSSLGGQAFAAILGLQVMQAQKMGAYDNIVPGSQSSAFGRGGDVAATAVDTSATQPQTAMPAPAEPAQAEADRQQQIAANPVFRPTPPTNVQPGAAPAEAPPVSMTGPASTASSDDMVTIESASGMRMQAPRHMVGEGPGKYSADPAKGGFHIVDEAPAGPVSQVPASQEEFAVLAQARQQAQPSAAPSPAQPDPTAAGGDVPPALLHTQARITPPWRIDEETYRRMKAAGVPDEVIFSTPGRMSA